jgi:acetyl-CoA carboxylase biotin carboxylase subunit
MRIVRQRDALAEAIRTAQSEAESSFGDPRIYLEKFLENPRHIEFQVIADTHGQIVHLGERECSIQRRHQKLIEETPSPAVSLELREELGQRVIRALRRLGYQNAGTVEFLFDQDGHFFFIEMNTRIQVEHPITEVVTGLDLVKEQILVAAGNPLSITQEEVHLRGHSIECRINAESPLTFAPSPGRITAYNQPGGPGIRVDSTAYPDWEVSRHYDSMIAKLVAQGGDRAEALARLDRALDMFVIEGIETTIPLHKKIINDPQFIKGNYGTSFLDGRVGRLLEVER